MKTSGLDALFDEIEAPAFSARIGLAGGFDSSLELARSLACVKVLFAVTEPQDLDAVLERTRHLAGAVEMPGFRHRYDDAVTIYLWALSEKDPGRAESAAVIVAGLRSTWRSRRMARRILSAHAAATELSQRIVGTGHSERDSGFEPSSWTSITNAVTAEFRGNAVWKGVGRSLFEAFIVPSREPGRTTYYCGSGPRLQSCPQGSVILFSSFPVAVGDTPNEYVQ